MDLGDIDKLGFVSAFKMCVEEAERGISYIHFDGNGSLIADAKKPKFDGIVIDFSDLVLELCLSIDEGEAANKVFVPDQDIVVELV